MERLTFWLVFKLGGGKFFCTEKCGLNELHVKGNYCSRAEEYRWLMILISCVKKLFISESLFIAPVIVANYS